MARYLKVENNLNGDKIMATKKLDFVKEYKTYYTAKAAPEVVNLVKFHF